MATRWERLAGDTSVFALRIAFSPDPDEGYGVNRETSLSWGCFEIWVEGRNLCAHLEDGERIDSVHWYLLPLIEWFVRNWNPLLHEERLPARNNGDTAWASLRATRFPPPAVETDDEKASQWEAAWQFWWARHAIRSASEGGLFPDIILRRLRDSVEVSWGPARGEGTPHHFSFLDSEKGTSRLAPHQVAEPLHDVLSSASAYLLSLNPDARRVKAVNRALRTLRAASNTGTRLMWLAGLGVDKETVRTGWQRAKGYLSKVAEAPRRAMLEVPREPGLVIMGSCHAALMFGSLAPDVRKADVEELARTMVDLYSPDGESEGTRAICRSAPVEDSGSTSWSQGYELAGELHERFDMRFAQGESVDIEGMVDHLGVTRGLLHLSDDRIRGVTIVGPQHRAGILFNTRNDANSYPSGRRFTLAHELCHLLFDREAGSRLAMASGPWAPRDIERRANAFAAMLLMPSDLVQRTVAMVTAQLDTTEGVGQVAKRLQAGFLAALRHLTNLGFIDETEQERIENEYSASVQGEV